MIKGIITNLACYRASKYLFRNLNFSLSGGQLLWVEGRNGAGKSTLLKILAGIISASKGRIEWHFSSPEKKSTAFISYLGHQNGLKKALTIRENIFYHFTLQGLTPSLPLLEKLLEELDLLTCADVLCHTLSLGQQRKVALAILILKQHPLWLLDEPFTALDKKSEQVLKNCLTQHLEAGGMSVMVNHRSMEKNHFPQIERLLLEEG